MKGVSMFERLSQTTLELVAMSLLFVALIAVFLAWRSSERRFALLRSAHDVLDAELAAARTALENEFKWRMAANTLEAKSASEEGASQTTRQLLGFLPDDAVARRRAAYRVAPRPREEK
jgi:hypothetical protein